MIALHPESAQQSQPKLPISRLITPGVAGPEASVPLNSTSHSTAINRVLAGLAIIDVSPSGKVTFATEKGSMLLEKYFPTETRLTPSRLPNLILQWLMKDLSRERYSPSVGVVQQGSEQLALRVTGREDGHFQLLLDERSDVVTIKRLTELGLTRKEAEVLLWLTRGKTDADIATILGCSPRTINKHTEQIRAKLRVETRTAAAAIAQEFVCAYC